MEQLDVEDAQRHGLEAHPRWVVMTPMAGLAALWIDHPVVSFIALGAVMSAYALGRPWQARNRWP